MSVQGIFYRDDFDAGLNLPVSSPYGIGTVSVSGGGLSISVPSGTNADWWYTVERRCALVYYDLGNIQAPHGQIKRLFLEATFKNISRGGTQTESYVTLYESWNAAYQLGTETGTQLFLRRIYAQGVVDLGIVTGLNLPLRCRYVWDRALGTLKAQYLQASGWVTLSEVAVANAATWFGLTQKNWGSYPSITTTWEDISIGYEAVDEFPPSERSILTDSFDLSGRLGARRPELPSASVGQWQSDIAGFEDGTGYGNARLSIIPQYTPNTVDSLGHAHFLSFKPYRAFIYYAYKDPWATPTVGGFSGYAKDGYKYTNGVQDAGPIQAPWASEVSSADRSNRASFPDCALIVLATQELVIFDLDNFPTSLDVWMRFRLANESQNYYAIGRGYGSLADAVMVNGCLYVGNYHTGWENGGLHCIDFKATGPTNAFALIRNDGQWIGASGRTIAQRNTNGTWASSGSNRINSTRAEQISIFNDTESGYVYAAVSGENAGPSIVRLQDNVPVSYWYPCGDAQDTNGLYYYRKALIDRNGWLWYSVRNRIYRNIRDWREAPVVQDSAPVYQRRYPYITLPSSVSYVTSLVDLDRYIAAGTDIGVFLIDKTTLRFWLAYTVQGGGGLKKSMTGGGDILGGDHAAIQRLHSFRSKSSAYLDISSVAGGGAASLIRFLDEQVFNTVFPTLYEDGAYFARTYLM